MGHEKAVSGEEGGMKRRELMRVVEGREVKRRRWVRNGSLRMWEIYKDGLRDMIIQMEGQGDSHYSPPHNY